MARLYSRAVLFNETRLFEQRRCRLQRLPDAPGQRDADEQPEDDRRQGRSRLLPIPNEPDGAGDTLIVSRLDRLARSTGFLCETFTFAQIPRLGLTGNPIRQLGQNTRAGYLDQCVPRHSGRGKEG
jgi:hypothetical protein